MFLGLDDLRDVEAPAYIVAADVFAGIISGLGISNDDQVVVYDTEGGARAARLWWALQLYGHERVRILDGGFRSWELDGWPVESGNRIVPQGAFVVGEGDRLRAEIDEVVAALSEPSTVIIDALSAPFHAGKTRLYAGLRAGHIPGAINMPAPDNFDPATDRLMPPDALEDRRAAADDLPIATDPPGLPDERL